jgi:hypothetical protein
VLPVVVGAEGYAGTPSPVDAILREVASTKAVAVGQPSDEYPTARLGQVRYLFCGEHLVQVILLSKPGGYCSVRIRRVFPQHHFIGVFNVIRNRMRLRIIGLKIDKKWRTKNAVKLPGFRG